MLSRKPLTPEKKQQMLEKQRASRKRLAEKQIAKQRDPEYRKAQIEKGWKKKQAKLSNKTNMTTAKTKPAKSTKSNGMKGRARTASELKIQNIIGALPCICCKLIGKETYPVTLHHTNGRTKKWAHAMVLPLCQYHHDVPLPKELQSIYPYLIPVHAKGSWGGKAAFEAKFGTQEELLTLVYELIGIEKPWIEELSTENAV